MPEPLSLKKIRKELIKSCDAWITRCVRLQQWVTIGVKTYGVVTVTTEQSVDEQDLSINNSGLEPRQSDEITTIVSDILVLANAGLIQEWLIFLDSVFEEGVRYCLRYNLVNRLPPINLKAEKLDAGGLVRMRDSICLALKDRFSFNTNYPDKINKLNKIFNYDPETQPEIKQLQSKMIKQVTVRNVWQHHWGEVRPRDLEAIGRPNQYFEMLDEGGNPRQFKSGQKIKLSNKDIDSLNKLIKDYSKKFEELK